MKLSFWVFWRVPALGKSISVYNDATISASKMRNYKSKKRVF